MTKTLVAALGLLLIAAGPAAAQTKSIGQFVDWEAFTYPDKAGKVCYAASTPKKTTGADKSRGLTYLSVTRRTTAKGVDEVSVIGGYTYKSGSDVVLDFGGAKHTLFVNGDGAWARDATTDKAIVQALDKGAQVTVHATSAKGAATTDTYSLSGFGKAYAEIVKACPAK